MEPGRSAWAVSVDGDNVQETYTNPAAAAPPRIRPLPAPRARRTSNDNESCGPWEIGTRDANEGPAEWADFTLAVFHQTTPGAANLRVADCGTTPEATGRSPSKTDGLAGFEVEVPPA